MYVWLSDDNLGTTLLTSWFDQLSYIELIVACWNNYLSNCICFFYVVIHGDPCIYHVRMHEQAVGLSYIWSGPLVCWTMHVYRSWLGIYNVNIQAGGVPPRWGGQRKNDRSFWQLDDYAVEAGNLWYSNVAGWNILPFVDYLQEITNFGADYRRLAIISYHQLPGAIVWNVNLWWSCWGSNPLSLNNV